MATCVQILREQHKLRTEVFDQAIAFVKEPSQRTQDVIADIRVFIAQLLSWSQLSEEERTPAVAEP